MRMLMRTLSGWMTYATLRATHLGVGRRQVLLLAGGLVIVMLALSPGAAVRYPSHREASHASPMDLPPTPSVASAATRPAEAAPPRVAPSSDDMGQTEAAPELVNPFNGRTLREEPRNAGTGATYPSRPTATGADKLAVEIARQEQELARVHKDTRALLRPPARPPAPRAPTIPPAQPLAIASQSALVRYRGVRITTWPGSTLGGWTVDAVFPDGIAIRHHERRAFLPLAFPSPRAR